MATAAFDRALNDPTNDLQSTQLEALPTGDHRGMPTGTRKSSDAKHTRELLASVSKCLGLETSIQLDQCLYIGNLSMRGGAYHLQALLSSYGTLIHTETLIKDKNFRFQNAIAIFSSPVSFTSADARKQAMVVSHRKLKVNELSQRRNCAVMLAILLKKLKSHTTPNAGTSSKSSSWNWPSGLARKDCEALGPLNNHPSARKGYSGKRASDRLGLQKPDNRYQANCTDKGHGCIWPVGSADQGNRYDPSLVALSIAAGLGIPKSQLLTQKPSTSSYLLQQQGIYGYLAPMNLCQVDLNHSRDNIRVNCRPKAQR